MKVIVVAMQVPDFVTEENLHEGLCQAIHEGSVAALCRLETCVEDIRILKEDAPVIIGVWAQPKNEEQYLVGDYREATYNDTYDMSDAPEAVVDMEAHRQFGLHLTDQMPPTPLYLEIRVPLRK